MKYAGQMCTLAMQINFAIPPNLAFPGQLEVFFLSLAKIQILYYIGNQFFIKFYSFYDSPFIRISCRMISDPPFPE